MDEKLERLIACGNTVCSVPFVQNPECVYPVPPVYWARGMRVWSRLGSWDQETHSHEGRTQVEPSHQQC